MTTKELIRAEIERRKNKWLAASRLVKKGKDTAMYAAGKSSAYTEILSFLDTLPDESEQPARGYDEAYLNEKIAKASKSWKGVDVDKFMDEIRGRELVKDCHDLEKEIKEQIYERFYDLNGIAVIGTSGYAEVKDMDDIARHFAEWGAEHLADANKMISDDLEEAKEEYLRKARRTPGHEWMTRDIEEAFKAGAEWMKKQIPMPEDTVIFQKGVEEGKKLMMEGAVEGEVCILPGNVAYVKEKNNESLKQYLLGNFKAGDEVRIIILPKEGEQ